MTTPIILTGNKITKPFIIPGVSETDPNQPVTVSYYFVNGDKLLVTLSDVKKVEIDFEDLIAFLKHHLIGGEWEVKEAKNSSEIFPSISEVFTSITLIRVYQDSDTINIRI